MTGSMIVALFTALAGTALASGHDLGAVELDRRLYGYEPEPASWCFTYFSCYLAPLETFSQLPGAPVVTTITSIVQITTLYPTPILTTPLSLPAPPSSVPSLNPTPSPLPGPVEIILAIIPTVFIRSLEKRRLDKRDLGGFISDVGSPNPKDCKLATVYRLDSARLQLASRLGASVFADAGASFTEFRARDSLNAGANIAATIFLDDDLILRWRNPSFDGGEAGFCQVPATGQVYATFVDSPTQWPAGCLPIRITVLDRMTPLPDSPKTWELVADPLPAKQCLGGETTSSPVPGTTSISTAVRPPSPSGQPETTPAVSTSLIPNPDSSTQPKPTTTPFIPPPPETTSGFNPEPPVVDSTSLSSSSQTSGTTRSTASTKSTQSESTESTSRSASTESTSQSASTKSTASTTSTQSKSSDTSSSSSAPPSSESSSMTVTSEISTTGTSSTVTLSTLYGNSTTKG